MEKITAYLTQSTVSTSEVKAWEEIIELPTYEVGKEEKNPVFLEKRVYQGSSGVVYPYPVIEKISDEKTLKPYRAVFIENEYIKIMVLPELGGRVQMAYDKVKQRHFVYYNQVIKPALVGLVGPWISGGIEFNWPQHHRPTTFMATECHIEEFEDGSKTVWCSEVERMFRTKGMAGFTLYPGKSYLEIKAKVYNRTSQPQTFLWWANPAVVVNDNYFSVFPPDVTAVFDHGKRDVSSFPIATGTYYKCDYSAGVDISRYKNIPVPTSYMATGSKYDFVGGYEDDIQAGVLHVADHNVSIGKKQWTWGNCDFGLAWDRNLTDEDGPYIELMTGMYCDNQPDFAWLQPYEEKSWKQYFMPYQQVGMVKNATHKGMVNIEPISEKEMKVVVYGTGVYPNSRIVLSVGDKIFLDTITTLSPTQVYNSTVECDSSNIDKLKLEVFDQNGSEIVTYQGEEREKAPALPDPAKAALEPKDIESMEQLFLTGHHIEQYRHATYLATDYYEEALRRDPSDIRCNNAMGLLLMRRGQIKKAKGYLEAAVATQISRNPNPYDGEPYYNLGMCKKYLGLLESSYKDTYKATWNGGWQDSSYMMLAQIDMMRGNFEKGLDHIERSLLRNYHNHKGRQLKCSFLRKMGNYKGCEALAKESLKIDLFNLGCTYELYLLKKGEGCEKGAQELKSQIKEVLNSNHHTYLEYALDYSSAGMYCEAMELLGFLAEEGNEQYPMTFYALGYFASLKGDKNQAIEYYKLANNSSPDYCFPNKIEEVLMLESAIALTPELPKAHYFLGNFWYGARQYSDAIECWETSLALDDKFPTLLRNLSLALYNKKGDKNRAVTLLEKAFELDPSDSRILMELDQLYKKMQKPHCERLALLEKHPELVEMRDDLCIEQITLLNQIGEYEKAYNLLSSRQFHPWEGGEGKVTGQYVFCRLALSLQAIKSGDFERALALLKETEQYPHNLGEGKLTTTEENDVDYLLGCVYKGLGNEELCKKHFTLATKGSSEPSIAFYYNDQQPDKIFYQALAWQELGNNEKAEESFKKLIANGEEHMNDSVKIDYFAVSLPDLLIWDDDLNLRNKLHCNFVIALGNFGLGNKEKGQEYLNKVREIDINHQNSLFIAAVVE